MPKPIPSSYSRAATAMSASDGSSSPDGWLCTSISPRCANPGRASTLATSPRATTREVTIVPPSSSPQAKQTSRPPAIRTAARMATATFGANLETALGRVAGTTQNKRLSGRRGWRISISASLPTRRPTDLGFQRLLLSRWKQHVIEDQPVPRRCLVQRQVRRRVADRVLRVLGIVAAIVRPGAFPVVAVYVLHPRRPFLECEDRRPRLQHRFVEARRDSIEVADHGALVLHQHGGD